MDFTSNFLQQSVGAKTFSEVFKPRREVYTIKDCLMTESSEKADAEKSFKESNKKLGGELGRMADIASNFLCSEIPILTQHEYFEDLRKQTLNDQNNFLKLKRIFVPMSENMMVGAAIILPNGPQKPKLITEVYQDWKFVKCVEYDFVEAVESYNKLNPEKTDLLPEELIKEVKN